MTHSQMGENPVLDVVRVARRIRGQLSKEAINPGEMGSLWWALDTALKDYDQVEKPYHVINLREDGFTIQHPLSCRPNLFTCTANTWGRQELSGDEDYGSYRLDQHEDNPERWIVGDVIGDA